MAKYVDFNNYAEENRRASKIINTFHAPQHPKNETTTIMQLVIMISNEVPPYKPMVKSLPFALAMSSTSWLKS